MDEIKKFKVGESYFMRSICDHECVWKYKVVARTAKTVTLESLGNQPEQIKRRVSVYQNKEFCRPLGKYSMSPILDANRIYEEKEISREYKFNFLKNRMHKDYVSDSGILVCINGATCICSEKNIPDEQLNRLFNLYKEQNI